MKRISKIIFILLLVFIVSGCSKNTNSNTSNNSSVSNNSGKIDDIEGVTSSRGTLNCVRNGSVTGGSGSFNYTLQYKNGVITYLKAVESVTIENQDSLKEFEDAYNSINSNYKGINYYDASVSRDGNTVTNTIVINYDKIDIQKLIDLEGEEDNIYEDGKPKLELWLKLGKKVGVSCTEG